MRTIKVVEEDHTRSITMRTVYVVDRPTERIEENELVKIVFLDDTNMIVRPGQPDRNKWRCEGCCLGITDRCCAYIDTDGYYVCLFRGMPAKSIDALLEEL